MAVVGVNVQKFNVACVKFLLYLCGWWG